MKDVLHLKEWEKGGNGKIKKYQINEEEAREERKKTQKLRLDFFF